MSKYIGTPVVNISADTVDVTGDITTTDATPEVIIVNNTHEDTDGGREGKVTFKGQQSGGEETTLAEIQASHDGTADDEKGDLIFKTNDGSDGASPTERMRIDSAGDVTLTGSITLANGESINSVGGIKYIADSDNDAPSTGAIHNFFTDNGSTSAFTILKNGNIGIADTAPDGSLHITRSNSSLQLVLERTTGNTAKFSVGLNSGLVFTDLVSSAERMRIDNSGNVGIGTDSPSYKLTVKTDSGGSNLRLENGSELAFIRVEDNGDLNLWAHGNEATIFTNGTGSGTENARIDGNGNLLVGNATFNQNVESLNLNTFAVEQATGRCLISASVQPMELARTAGDTNSRAHVQFFREGVNVGTINTTGSATAYGTSSDYRLKENVTNVTDGITRVKQLSPKRFNFIIDADTTVDGFLAHEAQTVVPEAVYGTKDEVEVWAEGEELPDGVSVGDNKLDDNGKTIPVMQGIDQAKLVPLLTAALQEAIAKIETLETKVAALEGE